MDQLARSPKQIGAVLRRRRRALGLTQSDVAAQASLRQATVSSAETGDPMQLDTLFNLLTVLELEIVLRPRSKGGPSVSDVF